MSTGLNRTTVFRQLILNVIIPVVIAITILAVLNYSEQRSTFISHNSERNKIISDIIGQTLLFQDKELEILEKTLSEKLKVNSDTLIYGYFAKTDSIETADLNRIRSELEMNPELEDIYIINRAGVIVNTTFKNDLNIKLFEFGDQFKNFLLDVFDGKTFVNEKFTTEMKTKKIKKYTYHPTLDGKYLIQTGNYSDKANTIIKSTKETLNNLSNKYQSIQQVDLFIGADKPFSLNQDTELDDDIEVIKSVFKEKTYKTTEKTKNDKTLQYEYMYMERKNTDLYKDAVIRILSDKSHLLAVQRWSLIKTIIIFLVTSFIVSILIYRKTRVITRPIKKLLENVNRITDGNLTERAEVEGNNEITKLSEQFNMMVERLEEYYNDLEKKVKERTAEISKQKDEIEEQKKSIMDSIHYAKRIQNAILPPDDLVKNIFKNSFTLYKPKDIVSGDFYWVNEFGDDKMFAVVDCTGHGVPGAFMSIVGNDQLNYAVNVKGAKKPSEILDALNEGVTNSLRQRIGSNSVKDGMDIALCSINFEEKKMSFAGAYNPVYLVRNKELIEIAGNKFPIGGYVDEQLQKFSNQELDLVDGDAIYIFSDGYADQFGGPRGKKLKYKKFRELLIEIQDKSMDEQKEILEHNIEQWRGDIEQVDDILVVGIKI